jgi:hypothetical protein
MAVDLKPYLGRILSDEDQLLFEDAVKSAECGALRASYIMIWLSCAESLKRRFREAQKRDGNAGKIVGEINDAESQHRSVDKLVLERAKEYGFLSDSAPMILLHIYEMRCIYGHPYEEAPTEEQLIHAASSVVEHLLSRPVTLKHGFCQQLLRDLTTSTVYLDDYKEAVQAFASDVLLKIDKTVFPWLFEEYAKKLDALDPTLKVFMRRGQWFLQQMVKVDGEEIFDGDEWLRIVRTYKTLSVHLFCRAEAFQMLGERAQDCMIGIILEKSVETPSLFQVLDYLNITQCLTSRQAERIKEHFDKCVKIAGNRIPGHSASWLRATGLRLPLCLPSIIELLKSHNYHTQNPAAELVAEKGADAVAELDKINQEVLGRNILQSADGGAYSSIELIEEAGRSAWPSAFVKGLFFECFINETGQIRIKDSCLEKVLKALAMIAEEDRVAILADLAKQIRSGTIKSWVHDYEMEHVNTVLEQHSFAIDFKNNLNAHVNTLLAQLEQKAREKKKQS